MNKLADSCFDEPRTPSTSHVFGDRGKSFFAMVHRPLSRVDELDFTV
jgi:hypothetical protein